MQSHELILPDLGIDDRPITVSLRLRQRGSRVVQGDPVLEILAGPAAIELAAPADGVLAEILVEEDDRLSVGQPLAVIRSIE
jgi:pyruvate/2-oxoglutarate dehydrogenase complex dihydrolipoamide acyltransferase (E2) component